MTPNGLMIPFGLAASGRMMAPTEVSRGLACACVCPKCQAPLIARQGERSVHHFAHAAETPSCQGAVESALHKMAKQIVADARIIRLPPAFVDINGESERIMWPQTWAYDQAACEQTVHGLRPDVVVSNQFRTVAVEIFVAHRAEQPKINQLAKIGLDAIEIGLPGIPWDIAVPDLEVEVLRRAPRYWLFNGITARAAKEKQRLADLGQPWRYPV